MDIIEVIKGRRSIRKFKPEDVPQDLIEKILEAGRWAPSGLNNQPWRFAIIKDPDLKLSLSKMTRYSHIISGANILIAVFLDNSESYDRTKDVQAVGACIENMLLETHSIGLGAVWLGEILKNKDKVRETLGLKDNLELMAMVALGYPAEGLLKGSRKGLKELVIFKK